MLDPLIAAQRRLSLAASDKDRFFRMVALWLEQPAAGHSADSLPSWSPVSPDTPPGKGRESGGRPLPRSPFPPVKPAGTVERPGG